MELNQQTAPAPNPFSQCVSSIRELAKSLEELSQDAAILGIPPLEKRDWYELLHRKLMPQLGREHFLVAAVVGGTNIGKSVVFNHLAGTHASAISPLASGTKHPVCLVPRNFGESHDLQSIFPGFQIRPWSDADAALQISSQDFLFIRENTALPENLLVLDTPDIDSDAEVNWHRAECILHAADVLIAVLTQQKYNDAAVKRFFRKAGEADKVVIVLFNQCLLPEDHAYWPAWLRTFSTETGTDPELVYVAPNDRRSADQLKLPFYEQEWPSSQGTTGTPANLSEAVSRLHFGEIKLRTLRASLRRLLDPKQGTPAYLEEVRLRSLDFSESARLLSHQQVSRISEWPQIAPRVLVQSIRSWWRSHREGWTKTVHEAYDTLGQVILWPISWATSRWRGPKVDPFEDYRTREREAMLNALGQLFEGLSNLGQREQSVLGSKLANLLSGDTRRSALETLRKAHEKVDLSAEVDHVVEQQMMSFRQESPEWFEFLKKIDVFAAAARPVTSVALFLVGGGPLGDAIAPLAHDAAAQFALHIAGGTGAVLAGETAIKTTGTGLRTLEAHFRKVQEEFVRRRLTWLGDLIKQNYLGDLQDQLLRAARLPETSGYQTISQTLQTLRKSLAD